MSQISDGPVLAGSVSAVESVSAAEFGSGMGGLLVVLLLGAVSIGLFIALSGSLKRMRANVESGRFSAAPRAEDPDDSSDDHSDHDAGIAPRSAGKVPDQGNGPAGS